MYVHSRFFPRKEVETEAAIAKNRWAHGRFDTGEGCCHEHGLAKPESPYRLCRLSP
jgi:hypothetical protein